MRSALNGLSALVVDDNTFVRDVVVGMLEDAQLSNVAAASDGEAALGLLRDGLRPDLIICDINMRPMNGLELIELIQANQEMALDPAVIVLTACPDQAHLARARACEVDAFLLKPASDDMLLSCIEQVLDRRQAKARKPRPCLGRKAS